MINVPVAVYINGKRADAEEVSTVYDALDRTWQVYITMPELAAAQRLLPDVGRGVSLDHVMNNWSRQ